MCGIGYGLFQSPNNRELIDSGPRDKSASAGGLLATFRLSGQTLGAALVAIVFGIFGASFAGTGVQAVVQRAAPAALWLACGCALVTMLAKRVSPAPCGSGDRGVDTTAMQTSVDQLRALGESGATILNVGANGGDREVRGAVRYRPHDLLAPEHLALPIAHDKPVVLYDENGSGDLTKQIAERLKTEGFDARILEGGFAAWERAGGPTQEATLEQVVPPTRPSQVQELDRRI